MGPADKEEEAAIDELIARMDKVTIDKEEENV